MPPRDRAWGLIARLCRNVRTHSKCNQQSRQAESLACSEVARDARALQGRRRQGRVWHQEPSWNGAGVWQPWHATGRTGRHFSSSADDAGPQAPVQGGKEVLGRIEPRLAMVYTCTKCETRSMKTFSRVAYTQGLVLVRCPGCDKLHLVSDHLGWFGTKGWTIEDLQAEAGVNIKVFKGPLDPGATGSGAPPGGAPPSVAAPEAEDWVGWSRVQGLIEVTQGKGQGTGGSGDADAAADAAEQGRRQTEGGGVGKTAGQGGTPGATTGSGGVPGARDATEGEVWEIGPNDLERWRKVRGPGSPKAGSSDSAREDRSP